MSIFKDSEPDNLESDLEEGEIPENELSVIREDYHNLMEKKKCRSLKTSQLQSKWGFNRDGSKENFVVYLQRSPRSINSRVNSFIDGIRKKPYGNDSPPSEGECISEDEKYIGRVQTLNQDVYINDDSIERRARYQPFKSTYGSVEDIMTKIGRTLGRNNNCYYKRRRSKEARYDQKLNGGHTKEVVYRKTSPLIVNKLRNNYYQRRRSESNSDSDSNRWEKSGKSKSQNMTSRRGKGKDSSKKRKRDHGDSIFGNVNSPEIPKKLKAPEKYQRDFDECRKEQLELLKAKSLGLNSLPFEEIPLPQEKGHQASDAKGMDRDNNSAYSTSRETEKKTTSENRYNDVSPNENSSVKNSPNICDHHSTSDQDEDDTELIKLRLLALSSNKKKNQAEQNKEEGFRSDSSQRGNTNISFDFTDDDDSLQESRSVTETASVTKCYYDNDIDRNELLLRAEALKTALLKKHQRRIKKQKTCASTEDEVSVIENSSDLHAKKQNVPDESNSRLPESDVHEEEIKSSDEKHQPSTTANPEDVTQGPTVSSDFNENVTQDYESCEMMREKELEIDTENSLPSQNLDPRQDSPDSYQNVTNESSNVSSTNYSIKNICKENQYLKRQMKRRCTKTKRPRSLSLKECSIKENKDKVTEKQEDDDQNVKTLLSDESVKKEMTKEHEKKFILMDSLQNSNVLQNITTQATDNKFPLEQKAVTRNSGTEKSNGSAKIATKVKMPTTEIQRIIIHLGSESSEEETAPQNTTHTQPEIVPPPKVETKSSCPPPTNAQNKMIDYERNVELLLREARLRLESKCQGTHSVAHTPEAVYNHLPPSQRLEYMRLKQKIAEREKLKNMRDRQNPSSANIRSIRNCQETHKRDAKRESNVTLDKKTDVTKKMESKLSSSYGDSSMGESVSEDKVDGIRDSGRIASKKPVVARNCEKTISNINTSNSVNINKLDNQRSQPTKTSVAMDTKSPKRKNSVKIDVTKNDAKGFISKGLTKKNVSPNGVNLAKSILEKKQLLTQNKVHLERLKIIWKNIKMEKMVEEKYEKELKKLKIQQNLLELKASQQRLKIKKLAEESNQIYEAFRNNNKGVELSAKKKTVPTKKPAATPPVESKTTKEATCEKEPETRNVAESNVVSNESTVTSKGSLCDKIEGESTELEVQKEGDKASNENKASACEVTELKEYCSPLQLITAGSESSECPRVDPNTIMCQFDLLGKCNDEECVYQHWRTRNN